MQNNRLPALAQQFDTDFLDGPAEPTPEEAAPEFDRSFLESPAPVDPQPVVKPDLTPREWVMSTLSNIPRSAWQNVGDMLSLIRPFGKRAGGETTLVPGIADLARLFAESQHKGVEGVWNPVTRGIGLAARGYTELDERLFGGVAQAGNETPLFDAFTDYITGRYDFSKPEVRAAFSEVVREDPVGVLTDLMTVPSIAFGGGGAAAKAAATTTKVSARMAKVLRGAQKANNVVNRGFHVPGVPGKVLGKIAPSRVTDRGFQVRTGIADIADPGVWALRGVGRGVQAAGDVARRASSPYKPQSAADQQAQDLQAVRLARQGFTDTPPDSDFFTPQESIDDVFTPLSMVNRSEQLLQREAGLYDKDFGPIREAVEKTENQVNARVSEIVNNAHVDGDIAKTADALTEIYTATRTLLQDWSRNVLSETGIDPGLVVDMRPVYTVLQSLKQQDQQLARLAQEAGTEYTPFADDPGLRRLDAHLTELAAQNKNQLTPDFLAEAEGAGPATPVVPSQQQPSAPRVEDELYGTPTRQSIDTNTGRTYATTYRVMDLYDIITSHIVETQNTLIARDNPDFDKTLQVKDMKLAAQLQKVWDIARNLFPDHILGGNRTIQAGTPIIDKRDMSISGNHRLEALRVAIVQFPEKAQAYQDRIPGEMARFGLTTDTSQMGFPVLVRVLDDDVDLQQFARAGNVAEQSQLSETAQATQDLHIVDDALLDLFDAGDGSQGMADILRSGTNDDFRQRFIGKLSSSEQAQFVTGKELSKRGEARITNALTAKIFDGQFGAALRSIFTEGASTGFRNIQRGIQGALPAMLRLRDYMRTDHGYDYNIAEPLAEAILKLQDFRENAASGKGVQAAINTYLQNVEEGGLFDSLDEADATWQVRDLDEKGRSLLRVLAVGVDKRSMLTDFLREYVETVRQSGDNVPAEEILDTIASKYVDAYEKGVSDDLKAGLAALFQYTDEADAPEATGPATAPTQPREPLRTADPVLLENVIAYRDALEVALRTKGGGPRLRAWRAQVVQALDDAVYDSAMAAKQGDKMSVHIAHDFARHARDTLNSTFAKLLEDLLDGTRNSADPAVQKAIQTVFTPNDTANSVRQKYDLMGGFKSDAAGRVRRIFLSRLFDFTRTDAGQADAAAVARGEQSLGDITRRYDAEGIRKYLNQFMVSATDYDDTTLRAILGNDTVNDLYDLDNILQAFGRFMKQTDNNQRFFGDQVRASIMNRITQGLGQKFVGGIIGGAGGLYGGGIVGGAIGSALGFLTQWLGRSAMNTIFTQLYTTERGRRALLDGIELSMRDAWEKGSRVLLRGRVVTPPQPVTVRGAARVARTVSKREEE